LILIGEASHGTQDFYQTRATLTQRLIDEHGFRAVVCEADWPDSFRVHVYVTGRSDDPDAIAALSDLRRFPAWMWRNTVTAKFIEWLRHWNGRSGSDRSQAGFFGMDLYSLHTFIESVLDYLERVHPAAARRARHRYATTYHGKVPCEDEVVFQLLELQSKQRELLQRDGHIAAEEFFSAEQNARLVMNAERYYRSMFHGRDESWNLRDTHMFETLLDIRSHLDDGKAKVIVWAHNSHLGDARATSMSASGELNIGQLVRERFGREVFTIGFTTYSGTVTAARDWGQPAERRNVRPALRDSYERLFHATGIPRFWLDLQEQTETNALLAKRRLERAIGVIYRPKSERGSHYFEARLPQQFDAVIHLDETRALEPLERTSHWEAEELPETYPSAL
jgi:erythromycin esterase-like protein